jgi:hypothetical protein
VKQQQRLRGLLPQCCIVTPEPLEGAIVNVGQAKKATSQGADRHGERVTFAICLFLSLEFENQRWQLSVRTGFSLWRDGHHLTFVDDIGLDLKEISLDRNDPPQAPEQRGQPQHEFALVRRPGIIVRDYDGLERAVELSAKVGDGMRG